MSLRQRLILSHAIPILIIIPLMGLILVYALERTVFVPRLTREISGDLDVISHIASRDPSVFQIPSKAQSFVDEYTDQSPWRLMLINPEGLVLASNDPSDARRVGIELDRTAIETALEGGTVLHTDYSYNLSSEVIDAWTAIRGPSGQVLGIVRISQPLDAVVDELMHLRSVVGLILVASLGFGVLIGFGLAVSLERPLRSMTLAFEGMTGQREPTPIDIQGPEEMQMMARAFNQLSDRLREMEATRKQLLANLVHELGRPLGALRSAIRALNQGAFQDDTLRHDLLSGMDMQTRSLERLVADLTQLYDKSIGRLEMNRERTDLNLWLRETLRPWQANAEEKGQRWVTDLEPLPFLWIDPLRLGQALSNLLSNAIKFTQAGGEVRVRASVGEGEACLYVEDTGSGLTDEDKEHLFTAFYRGHHGSRFPQGMGLGLTIAREIVLAHGGSIEVDSTPGKGSRFVIHLPFAHQPEARPTN